MGFAIAWSLAFEAKLRTVHWRHAARLCEAVVRYAEAGEGEARVGAFANERRLYVNGYCVHLTVDVQSRTLTVWTFTRYR